MPNSRNLQGRDQETPTLLLTSYFQELRTRRYCGESRMPHHSIERDSSVTISQSGETRGKPSPLVFIWQMET